MPKKGNTLATLAKRRNQLTRQLVLEMLDKKKDGHEAPGLLSKLMIKLDTDLDSEDVELRHKAMDKIIKLLPFVISKERGPAVQVNVQNNTIGGPQITAGKTTSLAIDTMQNYLDKRNKRSRELQKPQIGASEIIDVEMEDVTDSEGEE